MGLEGRTESSSPTFCVPARSLPLPLPLLVDLGLLAGFERELLGFVRRSPEGRGGRLVMTTSTFMRLTGN